MVLKPDILPLSDNYIVVIIHGDCVGELGILTIIIIIMALLIQCVCIRIDCGPG